MDSIITFNFPPKECLANIFVQNYTNLCSLFHPEDIKKFLYHVCTTCLNVDITTEQLFCIILFYLLNYSQQMFSSYVVKSLFLYSKE